MLHLAEIKKQPRGIIGGIKTELKLLARQEKDQSWVPIGTDETVVCDYVSNLGEGALVLVHLGSNKQIQEAPEPAGAKIVRQLQNFSRLLEKNKSEDERIEMWKQSLTAQAEVLSQRGEEINLAYEQMEAREKELETINEQRLEIESSWQRLKVEQQEFEALKQKHLLSLNEEQSRKIQHLTSGFNVTLDRTNVLRENLDLVLTILNAKQNHLNHHWQQLENHKQQAHSLGLELNNHTQQLADRKQQLNSGQKELAQAEHDWQKEQILLKTKEDYLMRISAQLQVFNNLQQEINRMELGETSGEAQVDIEELENMPLGDLQKEVERLEQDLRRDMNFVNQQEEELKYHSSIVYEIEQKLKVASQEDRISIQADLVDAQESKRMLDETLQGQRPKLRKKRQILSQYLRVLSRRQEGQIDLDTNQEKINLQPLIVQLEEQQSNIQLQKEKLEADIHHIRQNLEKTSEWLEQQKHNYSIEALEIQNKENTGFQNQLHLKFLQSQIELYDQILQPQQDSLNQMREKVQFMEGLLNDIQKDANEYNSFAQELQQILNNLLSS